MGFHKIMFNYLFYHLKIISINLFWPPESLRVIGISATELFLPIPTNFLLNFRIANLISEPRLFFKLIYNFQKCMLLYFIIIIFWFQALLTLGGLNTLFFIIVSSWKFCDPLVFIL